MNTKIKKKLNGEKTVGVQIRRGVQILPDSVIDTDTITAQHISLNDM